MADVTGFPSPDPTAIIGRRTFAALIDVVLAAAASIFTWTLLATRIGSDAPAARIRSLLDFDKDADGHLVLSNGRPRFATVTRVVEVGDTSWVFQGWLELFLALAVPVLALAAMAVGMQGRFGFTPGKFVAGLRTVGELGHPVGQKRAGLRTVSLLVDAFPYFAPVVGPVLAFGSYGHQRLGDRRARSFVVDRAYAGRPLEIPDPDIDIDLHDDTPSVPRSVTYPGKAPAVHRSDRVSATSATAAEVSAAMSQTSNPGPAGGALPGTQRASR
jgi:hypothetical protein